MAKKTRVQEEVEKFRKTLGAQSAPQVSTTENQATTGVQSIVKNARNSIDVDAWTAQWTQKQKKQTAATEAANKAAKTEAATIATPNNVSATGRTNAKSAQQRQEEADSRALVRDMQEKSGIIPATKQAEQKADEAEKAPSALYGQDAEDWFKERVLGEKVEKKEEPEENTLSMNYWAEKVDSALEKANAEKTASKTSGRIQKPDPEHYDATQIQQYKQQEISDYKKVFEEQNALTESRYKAFQEAEAAVKEAEKAYSENTNGVTRKRYNEAYAAYEAAYNSLKEASDRAGELADEVNALTSAYQKEYDDATRYEGKDYAGMQRYIWTLTEKLDQAKEGQKTAAGQDLKEFYEQEIDRAKKYSYNLASADELQEEYDRLNALRAENNASTKNAAGTPSYVTDRANALQGSAASTTISDYSAQQDEADKIGSLMRSVQKAMNSREAEEARTAYEDYYNGTGERPDVKLADEQTVGAFKRIVAGETSISALEDEIERNIRYFPDTAKEVLLQLMEDGDYESAANYYKAYESEAETRFANKQYENVKDWASQNLGTAALATLSSGLTGSVAPATAWVDNMFSAIHNKIVDATGEGEYRFSNTNDIAYSGARITAALQEGTQAYNATTGKLEGALNLASGALSSAEQNVIQFALFGSASLPFMAASAAGQSTYQSLKSGATEEQAAVTGTVDGLIEYMTEKLPLDSLLDKIHKVESGGVVSVAEIAKMIRAQGLEEASEEVVGNIAENLFDMAYNGENSEFQQYSAQLQREGMSKAEADSAAFGKFFIGDSVEAAAAAYLSTFLLVGGNAVTAGAQAAQIGKEMKTGELYEGTDGKTQYTQKEIETLKLAQQIPDSYEGGRYAAEKLKDQVLEGKKLSNRLLGFAAITSNQAYADAARTVEQGLGMEQDTMSFKLAAAIAESYKEGAGIPSDALMDTLKNQIETDRVNKATAEHNEGKSADTATTLSQYQTFLVKNGVSLKDAKTRTEVLNKLIQGQSVSDKELRSIRMSAKLTKQILQEAAGVEIPAGVTNEKDLMGYYRSAHESFQQKIKAEAEARTAQDAQDTAARAAEQRQQWDIAGRVVEATKSDVDERLQYFFEHGKVKENAPTAQEGADYGKQGEAVSGGAGGRVDGEFDGAADAAAAGNDAAVTGGTESENRSRNGEVPGEVSQGVKGRGKAVSSKDFGLRNATTLKTAREVLHEDETGAMQRFRNEVKRQYGYDVVYTDGDFVQKQDGKDIIVRGLFDAESKRLFINANYFRLSFDQIGRHEVFHIEVANGDVDLRQMAEAFNEAVGNTEILDNLVRQYMEKLKLDEHDAALEEVFADLNGGFNGIRSVDVTRYQPVYDQIRTAKAPEAISFAGETETSESTPKYSLTEYSDTQKTNWENSKKIVVYESETQLDAFLDEAINDSTFTKKIYFGTVGTELAEQIMDATGWDFSGLNVTLRADNVRKIFSDHGRNATEASRGQRAVTKTDFLNIPEVIGDPDTITGSTYNGRPAAEFRKTIDGSRITVIAVDSGKSSLDLFVQTMYAGKQKGNVADLSAANATDNTPKASAGIVPNSNIAQTESTVKQKNSAGSGQRYSFAGESARTADLDALATAKQMRENGVAEETILQQTGWYVGADGKWRFEIDDSGMAYDPTGDTRRATSRQWALEDLEAAKADLRDALTEAQMNDVRRYNGARVRGNEAEIRQLYDLNAEKYGDAFTDYVAALDWAQQFNVEETDGERLADYLRHDALFEAYPELQNTRLVFAELPSGVNGQYNTDTDTITLNRNLRYGTEKTLVHEIQHAIQRAEGFATGSSTEYWSGEGTKAQRAQAVEQIQQQIEQLRELMEYDEESADFIESDIEQLQETLDDISQYLYENTAGEIEARDVAERLGLRAEERRNRMPNRGDENTVFAESTDSGYFSMSADEQSGIREQLRNHLDMLNDMAVVGRVNTQEYAGLGTRSAREKIVAELKKTGYKVERKGFGEIQFSENEINNSLNYKEKTPSAEDARRTGFLVLQNVLKRGIEIDGHGNHKGRNYDTVTIAAPVEINGQRGNMAVVVKRTKGNRYKVHRILTPDGAAFGLSEMTNAEKNTAGAVTNGSQSLGGSAPTINSAPDASIRNARDAVKQKNSAEVDEAERKAHDQAALDYFGKTYRWNETGYLLLNGTKLDFSGRHEGGNGGYRSVDHRDIIDALGEDYGGDSYTGGMVRFMQEGNIRISPESGGINLAVMPTKAQMEALSDFISRERGEVILDIDDANGNTISSTEYSRGTHANKVLQDIRNYFENGTTPEANNTPSVAQFRYSVETTEDGRAVAVVDSDILSDIDTSAWNSTKKAEAKRAAKDALLSFRDGVQVNGVSYKVNKTTRDEYTRSKATEKLYKTDKQTFADKMRTAANMDDVITASVNWTADGGLKHGRSDNFVDFTRGDVLIQAGENQYKANTIVGITDRGEYVLYDVVGIQPTKFSIKKESPTAVSGQMTVNAIQGDSNSQTVAEDSNSVKQKNSVDVDVMDILAEQNPGAAMTAENVNRAQQEALRRFVEETVLRNAYDSVGAAKNAYKAETKTSKARTNTFERLFSEAEKGMEGLRKEDMTYDVVREQESMDGAAARLAQDFDGEVKDLLARTDWTGEDLDTVMGALAVFRSEAQESGDYTKVVELAQKIRENATKGGQFVQAFAKYNRTTPEGLLVRALDTVDKAKNPGKGKNANPAVQTMIDSYAAQIKELREQQKQETRDATLAGQMAQGRADAKTAEKIRKQYEEEIRKLHEQRDQLIADATLAGQMAQGREDTAAMRRIRAAYESRIAEWQEKVDLAKAAYGEARTEQREAAAQQKEIQSYEEMLAALKAERDEILSGGLAALRAKNRGISDAKAEQITKNLTEMADALDAVREGDTEALIDVIGRQAKIRNTPVSKTTLNNLKKQNFEWLWNAASTQYLQIAQDYVKPSVAKKTATFQTISHLFNARTASRNVASNLAFSAVEAAANDVSMIPDLVLSLLTGKRGVGFDKAIFSKENWQGFAEGYSQVQPEIALDIETGEGGKYGTGRRTFKKTGGALSKFMSGIERLMGYELNLSDEVTKGSIRAETLRQLQSFVDSGKMTMEEAAQAAEQEMLYRTFQDDTIVGKMLGNLKKTFNLVGFGDSGQKIGKMTVHEFGLGDFVTKYTQVPGALVHRAIEFTPLGYAKALYALVNVQKNGGVKNMSALQQRNIALDIGRATTGSGLIMLFAALTKAGIVINADDEDDPDAKALRAASGISGTQLNISALGRAIRGESTEMQNGDSLWGIEFMQPVNGSMTIGALLNNSEEGARSAWAWLEAILSGTMQSMDDLSVMNTVQTIQSAIEYSQEESAMGQFKDVLLELARSNVSGFIPAPVRQVAQGMDEYYRDAYGSKDQKDLFVNQIKTAIPGLRQTLPTKQTNYGEDKKYGGSAVQRWLNALIVPGSVRTYEMDDMTKELLDVYYASENADVVPKKNAPYKIQIGNERYEMDVDERREYQETLGQTARLWTEQFFASDDYADMTIEERAAQLVDILKAAEDVAKNTVAGDMGIESAKVFDPDITIETKRLELAGQSGVSPSLPDAKSISDPTRTGYKYELTGEELKQRQEIYNDAYTEAVRETINSSAYEKEDDEGKAELVQEARSSAKDSAKDEFLVALQKAGLSAELDEGSALYAVRKAVTEGSSLDKVTKELTAKGTSESTIKSAVSTTIHEGYSNGDFNEATATKKLVQYGAAKDEDEAYWTIREWEGGEDWGKYDQFTAAVESGENLSETISYYKSHGVTEKTLKSRITSHFKPLYVAATVHERQYMKEYLLDAFEALGKKRSSASKDIDDWLED